MRGRKPIGWPRYMVARRLKSGSVAYSGSCLLGRNKRAPRSRLKHWALITRMAKSVVMNF
jgi:hypothetical protein